MNKIQLEVEKGDNNNIDPYCEVFKQHSSPTFLQGRGIKMSKSKGKEKRGGCIIDQAFFERMKAEWIEEITSNLASNILSQLQAANPHMNLVIPNFTTTTENANQVTREGNLPNDVELHPTLQEDGDEDY